MADDSKGLVLATGTLNTTPGSTVNATLPGEKLFFFRPETGEIYVCDAGASAKAVLGEAATLEQALIALGDARRQLADLLSSQAAPDQHVGPDEHQIDAALQHEQKTRDELLKQFKELSEANQGSKLMELLPMASSRNGKPLLGGKKFTYVRSSKVKSHFRSYKLSGADKPKMESFLVKSADGHYRLDRRKLHQAFTTVKTKIDVAEKTEGLWLPDTWSPAFVEGFNESAHFGTPEDKRDKDTKLAFSG